MSSFLASSLFSIDLMRYILNDMGLVNVTNIFLLEFETKLFHNKCAHGKLQHRNMQTSYC